MSLKFLRKLYVSLSLVTYNKWTINNPAAKTNKDPSMIIG